MVVCRSETAMALVELIPNVSEGRSIELVDELAGALSSAPDLWLLDVHRDPSHHRSVLTAVGRPEALPEAVRRLYERSFALVDLREHRGVHPRIGAVDVLPFVPLEGFSVEQAVALAHRVGQSIAREFAVPVFFYGDAAIRPDNEDLPRLRRGGFEALELRMARGELVPDCGPSSPHPTAGATAVGVRGFLIAFNIELTTPDLAAARLIARRIRASTGGLSRVKALGFELGDRGRAQVSMNLTDFRVTSILTAFETVTREAEALGVEVARSELVGLVPAAASFPAMKERLKLDSPPGILEERMREAGVTS
jgi:glutamate formiminotransferase / formiminotetrahydrofolate cyclodeaminase